MTFSQIDDGSSCQVHPVLFRSELWPRRIGILGGLGPHAHIRLEELLLDAAEMRIGRRLSDQEYPPWIAVSVPQVPDRTSALLYGGSSPTRAVTRLLPLLRSADFIVIPCNTMHAFFTELSPHCPVPLVDMIDTTIDHVEHRFGGNATIGLLASDGAIQSRVYQNRIATRSSSLTVLIPEQISHRGASGAQETVTRSIFGGMMGGIDFGPGLKGGAHRNPVYRRTIRVELQRLIGEFKGRGAQAIILGCTEFSLLREDLEAEGLSIPVVDSLGCLAVKAIDLASNQTGVSPRANIRSRNERAGR